MDGDMGGELGGDMGGDIGGDMGGDIGGEFGGDIGGEFGGDMDGDMGGDPRGDEWDQIGLRSSNETGLLFIDGGFLSLCSFSISLSYSSTFLFESANLFFAYAICSFVNFGLVFRYLDDDFGGVIDGDFALEDLDLDLVLELEDLDLDLDLVLELEDLDLDLLLELLLDLEDLDLVL